METGRHVAWPGGKEGRESLKALGIGGEGRELELWNLVDERD